MSQSSLSLWDIEKALHELLDMREEALNEDEAAEVEKALAQYAHDELAKADGIRGYLRHCETMEREAREEIERQKARRDMWRRREETLRRITTQAMQEFGLKRVEGKTGALVLCKNGGKLPVVIDDERAVPTIYKPPVIAYPVDKDIVRAALEAGKEVPGAHLGERDQHLEIR